MLNDPNGYAWKPSNEALIYAGYDVPEECGGPPSDWPMPRIAPTTPPDDEAVIEPKIVRNAAQCKLCGDVIESTYRHDFVSCSCGEIFVDGGLDYLRAGAKDFNNFIRLEDDNE